MKKLIYVIIMLMVFSSLQGCSASNKIEAKNYEGEGAIITIRGEKNWTPDKKIIDEFEAKLVPYINDFKSRDGNRIFCSEESLLYVRKNIKKYKRQYVGKIIDGRKVLHCNCLLINESDHEFDRWTREYIQVMDGGADFFNVNYDIETKKLLDFYINGVA